jgi:hypothetical protein
MLSMSIDLDPLACALEEHSCHFYCKCGTIITLMETLHDTIGWSAISLVKFVKFHVITFILFYEELNL